MAPYCAIPRDYLSDTPRSLRAMGFSASQHGQMGAIPPPPFLSVSPLESMSMRSGGAIPPLKRGISAILARYPMKTRQMGAIPPSAILSRKRIARYGGVSRTGPLSSFLTFCLRPFPLFFQANGIGHSFFFLLCDVGVGRQSERGGVPRWRCILFLP